ncbi:MAG: hypothetical protein ACKO23_07710 [Gemmataceae bacterium]
MKAIIHFSVMVLLFLVTPGVIGAGDNPLLPSAPTPPKETGKVLVLETERTLTGDIEKIGEQYRIRRLVGETWIPENKAIKLCSSIEEAYRFLQRRANLNDVDERMRLAEWCRQHGLRKEALEELQSAKAIDPTNQKISRLVAHLREREERATNSPVQPSTAPAVSRVEVSAEAVNLFATKIQPILMNACVSCHTGGRGGAFQLVRVTGNGTANRRSMEQNISAAMKYVNLDTPGLSPLLTKSASIHAPGMNQAPLRSRNILAFRYLDQWVRQTAEMNPHLREDAHASAVFHEESPFAAQTDKAAVSSSDNRSARIKGPADGVNPPKKSFKETNGPASGKNRLMTDKNRSEEGIKSRDTDSVTTNDPVDPDDFNKQFHQKPKESKVPPEGSNDSQKPPVRPM